MKRSTARKLTKLSLILMLMVLFALALTSVSGIALGSYLAEQHPKRPAHHPGRSKQRQRRLGQPDLHRPRRHTKQQYQHWSGRRRRGAGDPGRPGRRARHHRRHRAALSQENVTSLVPAGTGVWSRPPTRPSSWRSSTAPPASSTTSTVTDSSRRSRASLKTRPNRAPCPWCSTI